MNQRAQFDGIEYAIHTPKASNNKAHTPKAFNNKAHTPKAFNNKAQGRRAAAHPGETFIEYETKPRRGFPNGGDRVCVTPAV
jgi:hypothetical protein